MSDAPLSPTKQALLALQQMQGKLEAMERAQREPIAIVGMSCRFPGGVATPEDFWRLLMGKEDAITEVPSDRWSLETYHDGDPDALGKTISRYGGFIPHLYDFDAPFFRISPREAISLDPQQRLLLELGWEALEDAGIAPHSLSQQAVGVFVGISGIDYWHRLLAQRPEAIDAYLTTGNTHSIAAGRLSFLLGVTGPSLAVDAACASSLVAIHLACQSLRQQECHLALVGGVNRILSPEVSINFSKAKMLSTDGRCRSFDARASGFGRGEGGGMLLLKRLADAVTDGDRIDSVILGSAIAHNGRSGGLTVPSRSAQQAVIRQALAASGLDPVAIAYIETHGTGTTLGDPIEVGALGDVFSQTREQPLILGAVKTNIGHLEAASGIAGFIKTALVLQQGHIPANLHFSVPNPHIDWQALPFHVPTTDRPWPTGDRPFAGVSAFGFNGSTAHLIMGSPTPNSQFAIHQNPKPKTQNPKPFLLPLSAQTPPALKQLVARYARYLTAHSHLNLGDFCFTASIGRSHFAHRLAILSSSLSELRQILVDVLAERTHPACWQSNSPPVDAEGTPLENLARRYANGEAINWQALYSVRGDRIYHKVRLPTYPFQRQYFGIDCP
ncbi:type I polyketide synthase [Spirulina sp. 06S082]|uniref:type I polyketide synthase n=1 Tax=Spirulina sp. 06S082 TaxID=3110248 RepID=UPI002B21E66B|nr:beta-ketoacyl synthase N-terminal-like domain-containing protein [Spirulina sp. 06S082]MEA5472138.1 beta-ketoacyl synthase N-terminal-like domain-containing protein [Spirulina sp. 06S082]